MSKQEILSDLYTLRAGLSWISQKKQELDRLQGSLTVPKSLNEREVLAREYSQLDRLRNELTNLCRDKGRIEYQHNAYNYRDWGWLFLYACFIGMLGLAVGLSYGGYLLLISVYSFWAWIVFFIAASAVCSAVILLVQSFKLSYGGLRWLSFFFSLFMFGTAGYAAYEGYNMLINGEPFWTWVVFVLGGFALVTAICHFIASMILFHKNKYYRDNTKWIQKEKEALERSIQKAQDDLDKAKSTKLKTMWEKNDAEFKKANSRNEEIRNNQIKPLTKLCIDFYNRLLRVYGNSLDMRDWPYLDLVIYYVETNRAETIREALQLIDRERQTQQIVASMNMAAEQIGYSIKEGSRALGHSIQSGFGRLQSGIYDLQESVKSSAAQNKMFASMQISQSSLTNALLQKSNVTSEKLLGDVRYIADRGCRVKRRLLLHVFLCLFKTLKPFDLSVSPF